MDFTEAVDRHLAAVTARDLDAYLATVHENVALVLPNGKLVEGRQAVADFHRDWFSDPDWSWKHEPVRSETAAGTGVALVLIDYQDVDPSGNPYAMRYLLSMTFTRDDDGQWLLLHDQNTLTP